MAGGITIPMDAVGVSITPDGVITTTFSDGSTQEVGQIELRHFISPQGLKVGAGGHYYETEASGPPTAGIPGEGSLGTLRHKHLEASNVMPIHEMLELTKLARLSKAISQQLGLNTVSSPLLHQPEHEDIQPQLLLSALNQDAASPQATD